MKFDKVYKKCLMTLGLVFLILIVTMIIHHTERKRIQLQQRQQPILEENVQYSARPLLVFANLRGDNTLI